MGIVVVVVYECHFRSLPLVSEGVRLTYGNVPNSRHPAIFKSWGWEDYRCLGSPFCLSRAVTRLLLLSDTGPGGISSRCYPAIFESLRRGVYRWVL